MMVSTTSKIEKDFEDMALEHASLTTLAKDKLQRIQTLESLLERERTTSAELQQSLNKANEELQRLIKEKEMNDWSCLKAFKKFEEFKILSHQAQESVKEVEVELASAKATISKLEGLLRKKNVKLKVSESDLKKQAVEIDVVKAKIIELEKVNLTISLEDCFNSQF